MLTAARDRLPVPSGGRHAAPAPRAGIAAVVVALSVGCQSTNPWLEGAAGGSDERQIQVAALDFITDHYVRELRSREPTIYCVGLRPVGPIQPGPDLLEVTDRDDRWDPGGSAVRALQQGHDREIRPLSECTRDRQTREIHETSGAAAISFVAGPPRFETPGLALIRVEARESGQAGGHFRCRLERRVSGWAVDTCV